jgi:hypothetical protein
MIGLLPEAMADDNIDSSDEALIDRHAAQFCHLRSPTHLDVWRSFVRCAPNHACLVNKVGRNESCKFLLA